MCVNSFINNKSKHKVMKPIKIKFKNIFFTENSEVIKPDTKPSWNPTTKKTKNVKRK